jgi:hypothetical protein
MDSTSPKVAICSLSAVQSDLGRSNSGERGLDRGGSA